MLNETNLNVEWTQLNLTSVTDDYNHPPSICVEATQVECMFTVKQLQNHGSRQ